MKQKRTRREALQILGAASASVLTGCGGSSLAESQARRGEGSGGRSASDAGGNPDSSVAGMVSGSGGGR